MLPLTLKKLFKVEIFRLILNIHQILKKCPPNTKNWPKHVRKMYFMGFYLFCLGDLMTRAGEQDFGQYPGNSSIN